jgi:hypothetical protein
MRTRIWCALAGSTHVHCSLELVERCAACQKAIHDLTRSGKLDDAHQMRAKLGGLMAEHADLLVAWGRLQKKLYKSEGVGDLPPSLRS